MFLKIVTAVSPILVALIAIIPAVVSNRKKTQASIEEANKSAVAANKATDARIEKMQSTLDKHIREDEDDNARNRRYRILRFYDEMCEHRRHSESHFEDILDDIDEYEKYCAKHPDYKNTRGGVAMARIKAVYAKTKNEGGFLSHKDEEGNQ